MRTDPRQEELVFQRNTEVPALAQEPMCLCYIAAIERHNAQERLPLTLRHTQVQGRGEGYHFVKEPVCLREVALYKCQATQRAETFGHSIAVPPRSVERQTFRGDRYCPRHLPLVNQVCCILIECSGQLEGAV